MISLHIREIDKIFLMGDETSGMWCWYLMLMSLKEYLEVVLNALQTKDIRHHIVVPRDPQSELF
jgi:hypothetical protein